MIQIIKQLFCKHSDKECITNLYGDYIHYYNCRSIHRCKHCGKEIKGKQLNKGCKIINFKTVCEVNNG